MWPTPSPKDKSLASAGQLEFHESLGEAGIASRSGGQAAACPALCIAW